MHKLFKFFALMVLGSVSTPALADCGDEYFAVSRILLSSKPGSGLARQAYELRKSEAYENLSDCQRRENDDAERANEIRKRQQAVELERNRLIQDQARADEAARAQAYAEEANRQANASLLATISKAILEGRCEDAKTVALTSSRLDLADQAMRLCKPGVRKPASPTPQPTTATTYVPMKSVQVPRAEFSFDLPTPDGGRTCRYKNGETRTVAAGQNCPPFV